MDDSEADKDSGELISDESFDQKMMRALTSWNMILSFCVKILLKSCKYWKQLQKLLVLLWKTIVHSLSIIFVAFLENINFTQLASINDFYYFLERRVCCTQAMKNFAVLSLSIQFSSQREKSFTRFQSNHV